VKALAHEPQILLEFHLRCVTYHPDLTRIPDIASVAISNPLVDGPETKASKDPDRVTTNHRGYLSLASGIR
jgi:hypothetical protein